MLKKLRKSKQELQEEINRNNELIKKYDRNAKILEVNTFESKLQYFLGINFFLYWIPVFILLFMKFPALGGLSPFQTFPLITIGSSLTISIPLTIKRNNKASRLLNQISDAKTGKQILLEKTKYELEIEKLNNKNKAMENAIQTISKEERLMNDIKGKYDVKKLKKEDKNIEQTTLSLKEKEQKLNTISTKKFLNENFYNIRNKFGGLTNNCVQILMPITMITLISTAFPYSLIGAFHNFSAYHNINSILAVFASVLTPLALSIGGSALYIKNLANKEKKIFRKINSTLGNDALTKKESDDEANLDKELDSKIKELSISIVEEKNAKRNLESISKKSKDYDKNSQEIGWHHFASPSSSALLDDDPEGIYSYFVHRDQLKDVVACPGVIFPSLQNSCYVPTEEILGPLLEDDENDNDEIKGPTLVKR